MNFLLHALSNTTLTLPLYSTLSSTVVTTNAAMRAVGIFSVFAGGWILLMEMTTPSTSHTTRRFRFSEISLGCFFVMTGILLITLGSMNKIPFIN